MREQVLEMIMKTTMTTGMWKQLLRKMVADGELRREGAGKNTQYIRV